MSAASPERSAETTLSNGEAVQLPSGALQIVGRLIWQTRMGGSCTSGNKAWLESLGLGPMIVPAQPQGS